MSNKMYSIDLCEVENMLNSIDRVTSALREGSFDICENIIAMDDTVYAGADADAVRAGMNKMTGIIMPELVDKYETMRSYLYDYYCRLKAVKQYANGFGLELGVAETGTITGIVKCDFDAVSNVSGICTQIEDVCLDYENRINRIIDYVYGLRHEDGTKIINLMNQFGNVNSNVMKFMETNRNNIVSYATKYVSADDDFKTNTVLFLSTLRHNASDVVAVKRNTGKFAALGMITNINRKGAKVVLSKNTEPVIGKLVEEKSIDETLPIDTGTLFSTIFELLVKDHLTEEENTLLKECYSQVEMYGLEKSLWDSVHTYYLSMYAMDGKAYPFETQQNIEFYAKMWTWSVKYNEQEYMQWVVNVMGERDIANSMMLAFIDSEEAGKAFYTWVRICNTELPDGYSWVVIPSTVRLGCCYMGIEDSRGKQSVVFECMDMNKVVGSDIINRMKNEMSMSKEDIAVILSCIGSEFEEDVSNIKGLFSIELGDTQSYAKYFGECFVTSKSSQLFALYLYHAVDWNSGDFSNAMAYVNGILALNPSVNECDKRLDLLQEIESGYNDLYLASILNVVQENTQENRDVVNRIEYIGGSISALTYFFDSDVNIYIVPPKNCYIERWNYDPSSVSGYMRFAHTTGETEYVEGIGVKDVTVENYQREVECDKWLELRASGGILSRGSKAGENVAWTIAGLITKKIGEISIGTAISVAKGIYDCAVDLTYDSSDEMAENESDTIIDFMGARCIASYSAVEDKPSYMMQDYAIDGADSVKAVVFKSEISLKGALLYKELLENGTRGIAPLEPEDNWIFDSDCSDIELDKNRDLLYFEEKLNDLISRREDANHQFAIENKDLLRSVYSGGFDLFDYISTCRNNGEWPQFKQLVDVYGIIVGVNNGIEYVRDNILN